jgi:hypothetical protein
LTMNPKLAEKFNSKSAFSHSPFIHLHVMSDGRPPLRCDARLCNVQRDERRGGQQHFAWLFKCAITICIRMQRARF